MKKEHAKMWFKELNGIGNTAENLVAAAEGENYEWTDMYEGLQKLQKKKGFQNLQLNSVWLEKSKNIMKNVIEHYCIM